VKNTNNFLCSSCGACCRNVQNLPLPSTNGVCDNLDKETNKCKIYETRPKICRVDEMYDVFKDKYTKKQWFIENTKVCHVLIDKEGIEDSFKIDIKLYERE
jgi:Fe-S-cluster containining protein